MRKDPLTQIRLKGPKALTDALGPVEAERFVTLLLREPFDYTRWQRGLWPDRTVQEVSQAAMRTRKRIPRKARTPKGPV